MFPKTSMLEKPIVSSHRSLAKPLISKYPLINLGATIAYLAKIGVGGGTLCYTWFECIFEESKPSETRFDCSARQILLSS